MVSSSVTMTASVQCLVCFILVKASMGEPAHSNIIQSQDVKPTSQLSLQDIDDRLQRVEKLLEKHSASTTKLLDEILQKLDDRLPSCSPTNPCLHGGKCEEKEGGGFECFCPIGFDGKKCEKCASGFVEDTKDGKCKPDPNVFVGMFGAYKGSSYLVGKPTQDWDSARRSCQMIQGGDLASIETMEEWIFVWQRLRNLDGNGVHFLGAKGTGKTGWNWLSGKGSALHHQAWRYGKPSGSGPNCLVSLQALGYAVTDLWVDDSCGNQYGFLCEFTTS